MKLKKILAVAMAATLIAATAAGCGGTASSSAGTDSTASGTDSAANESSSNEIVQTQTTDFDPDERVASSTNDGFAKYEEPITLTVMTGIDATASSTSYNDSAWTKILSEKFNINLEYELVAAYGDEYSQLVSLQMASGSLPDVMNVSLIQMTQMREAGLLADMTSAYYDWVSDQSWKNMSGDTVSGLKAATYEGKLYGVPSVQPALEQCHALFYNDTLRQELNLEDPTTSWKAFEDMIYAFADHDSDGDGSTANNYGIGLTQNLWDTGFEATSIANAMGAYPNAWVVNEDGEVEYGSVQEEMKPVLEKLAKYYADGLIDPEFINKTFDQEGKLVATNQLNASFSVQWMGLMADACLEAVYTNTYNDKGAEAADALEWLAVDIPSYEGTPTSPIVYDNTDSWTCVSTSCEYPEAVTIICNYMHYMGQGPQGEGPEGHPELAIDYELWSDMWNNDAYRVYSPPTEHANIERWQHWTSALDDIEAGKEVNADTLDWINTNYLAYDQYYEMKDFLELGSSMIGKTNETTKKTYQLSDAAWQFTYRCCGETFMYALDCDKAGTIVQDVQGSYVSDTMVESQAALDDLEIQTFTRIITGEADISSFDSFVQSWNALGGEAITKEMNDYYKAINA